MFLTHSTQSKTDHTQPPSGRKRLKVSNLSSQSIDPWTSKQIETKNIFQPLERMEIEEPNSKKSKPKKTHENQPYNTTKTHNTTLIQWNCRGIWANYKRIQQLFDNYNQNKYTFNKHSTSHIKNYKIQLDIQRWKQSFWRCLDHN